MPTAPRRAPHTTSGRRRSVLAVLRLGAVPLVALAGVVAVVVGGAPQERSPVPVEVLLASFQDPSPPARVDLTVLDGRLTASWPASAEGSVRGYRVSVSDGLTTRDLGERTSPYDVTGLTNRTSYTVSVRTVTYDGGFVGIGAQGPFTGSRAASGTATPLALPPTGLAATTADRQLTLTWSAPADPTVNGYKVFSGGVEVATTNASTRTYSRSGLVNGQTHTATVRATYPSGAVSADSAGTSGVPRDAVAPAAPRGLAAAAGDGSATLTWSANGEYDVAGYRVLRDGAPVGSTGSGTRTLTDTGLTNGTTYSYALQALDTSGNASAASSPAVSATPADTTPPAVPAGLTAVRGDGQVALTWTGNTEADLAGYDLFRRSRGGGAARVSGAVLTASSASYTDTGLTNDEEYTYTLRARDRAGNASASSAPASATPTDLTAPAVPARPSAVAGDGVVSLSWTPNGESDLASYLVLRDGTVVATVTAPTTTYDDRAVTNGTAAGYALRAVDAKGNTSAATAPPVSATPRDLTPPAVPTGLSATRGDGRVVLSWAAGTEGDLASYRVLRDGVVVATVAAPATTSTDTGLANDTPHDYSLAAVDTAGNASAASSPVVTATPTDLTAPAAPNGVTSTPGDGAVDVAWTANTEPDLASYRVHRDGQLVATITAVAPPGTTPTSYRDGGLVNGAAHTYAVTAVDTHGNESSASTTGATPADTTAPGAPGSPSATPSDRQVVLRWTASPDPDVVSYRVLRDGVELATVPAPGTSSTDTTPANGWSYVYAVVAVDAAGNRSAVSGTVTATPRDSVAPGAPTGASATPGSGSATVRWTAPADTDLLTYRVLRADGTTAATASAPATSAVVTGLVNGTPVTFTVVVVDTSGNTSPASGQVAVTPAATTTAVFSPAGAGTSGALAVSRDGRWLVVSTAAALDRADTNGVEELYRVDTTGAVAPRRVAPIVRGSAATSRSQSSEVAVSDDGRYVVVATADGLASTDGNGLTDVYRADLASTTPVYALVSVPGTASGASAGRVDGSTAGTLLQESTTVQAKGPGIAVSADGTRVLFYSARTDLVPAGRASGVGVYAKDLRGGSPSTGPVVLVSTATGGGSLTRTPTGPALATTPSGRYAFFTATTPASGHVLLRKDLGAATTGTAVTTGELLVVSSTAPLSGEQKEVGATRDTGQVSVSDDGRHAAFLSTAKLTSSSPRATATQASAYLKDLGTGLVTAIGSPGSGVAEEQVSLSPDGLTATFTTAAPLLGPDTNTRPDAYRRDLASGALALVTADGSGAATASVRGAADRGRVVDLGGALVVVLTVQALDPGDDNGVRDVYAKDLSTGAVAPLARP